MTGTTSRRVAVIALVGWLLLIPLAGAAGAAGAEFSAVAAADTVRLTYTAPGLALVDTPVDVGAAVAQALVNGLGESVGFASAPYPGDFLIAGPPTLTGLLGLPSLPSYPLYTSSSYPAAPEKTLDANATRMHAKSDALTATASAVVGNSSATATATRTADRAVGDATAIVSGIEVAGVLRIGRVSGHATVTRTATGEPTRTSELAIEGLSVAGQAVAITANGLPDTSALDGVLAQAGIGLTYLAAEPGPDGIRSPALQITQHVNVPGYPTQVLTIVVGRVTVAASATGGAGSPRPTSPAGSDGVLGDSLSTASPAVGAVGPDATSALAPTVMPRQSGAGTLAVRPAARALVRPGGEEPGSLSGLYVLIVIGALLAVGGGQLFRLLGVRLRWRS